MAHPLCREHVPCVVAACTRYETPNSLQGATLLFEEDAVMTSFGRLIQDREAAGGAGRELRDPRLGGDGGVAATARVVCQMRPKPSYKILHATIVRPLRAIAASHS